MAGNWTNSGTFTANSGTVTLDGTSKQTLSGTLTGSSAFHNLTLTNSSGTDASDDERTDFVPGIDFDSPAEVSNDYVITTPSVRVEYESGENYKFKNINWNGVATDSRIFFRNSAVSGMWLLEVTGSQTVSYVNVSRSDASPSQENHINAYDGTNYDGGENINWYFTTPEGKRVEFNNVILKGGGIRFR